jgi:uncharacterized alpha-E superfamily protein
MQKGGGSKDTWVLSDGPVDHFSLLPAAVKPVELRRDGGDLPSRSADDLYWLGRHIERVECKVRLARGLLIRLTDQSSPAEVPELPLLLDALANPSRIGLSKAGDDAGERLSLIEKEVSSMLFDEDRNGSLAESIHALHRIAAKVRDRLSTDTWRILNGLDLEEDLAKQLGDLDPSDPDAPPSVRDHEARRRLGVMRDILDGMVISLAAFGGLVSESMTRGQGWRFLDMGRRLERALRIIDFLRLLATSGGSEGSLLEALLLIADSTMTYRRRYMNQLQAAPVLDLLLADEANPRSLAYQLAALAESIDQLPRNEFTTGRSEQQRVILAILTRLRVADINELAQADEDGRRPGLQALLDQLEGEIPILNDALTRSYFSHLQLSRQFSRAGHDPGVAAS